MKHFEIVVKVSRINGGFRFPIMERACKLGIKGYVARIGDSCYKIEAEGDNTLMEEFIEFCRKGPVGTPVFSITINEGVVVAYDSFDIR